MTVVIECARYGGRARIDFNALRLQDKLIRALALGPCVESQNK